MDSINKTSKIVVIIAVILFVVIVVGFVVGMFAMYKDMISDFEPDSGANWEFDGVYMDVPNINNIGDRIPDINYAYAAEGKVTYALSDKVMELDPAAKAVPFSQYSNYYEFTRSDENIKIDYCVYPRYVFVSYVLNLPYFLKYGERKRVENEYFIDHFIGTSLDERFYKNTLPVFDEGVNYIYDYSDSLNVFKNNVKDFNQFKYGSLSLISRGSGCILKLVNDETGEFVFQGGYDLSKVLLNEVIYDISNGIYEVAILGDGGAILGYQERDGKTFPKKYNVLSLFNGDSVTGLEIKDRELWDPNGQFSDYDSAYFYSYGDSYFEIVSTIGVPYWDPIAHDIGGYNEVSTYTRFRVY